MTLSRLSRIVSQRPSVKTFFVLSKLVLGPRDSNKNLEIIGRVKIYFRKATQSFLLMVPELTQEENFVKMDLPFFKEYTRNSSVCI